MAQKQNVESFMVDMINNFTKYYLKKSKGGILEGIDENNPASTNHHIEEFYRHMDDYRVYEKIDKEFVETYSEITDELKERINTSENQWYGIVNGRIITTVSKSLFAILIEFTNLRNESDLDYSIIQI